MNSNSSKDLRDIEREPIKTEVPRYGMGYEYYDWICPTCEMPLAWEPDVESIPRRCIYCGQLLKKPKDS